MSSGVQVDQRVINVFRDIKSNKSYSYVVMKIENETGKIIVDKLGAKLPPNCSQSQNEDIFNEMKETLGKEPRYILFDFCFERSNKTVSPPKLMFISWCSDDCCGHDKMLHASSKKALKAELTGLNTPEHQCSELSELSFSEIIKDLQKRDRV